jgi:hypothetical protein
MLTRLSSENVGGFLCDTTTLISTQSSCVNKSSYKKKKKMKKRIFEGFKRVRSVSRCDYRHLSLPLSPPPRF